MDIAEGTTAPEEEEKEDEGVKEQSWHQREALPGEPLCVICGRYGEYICNDTDDDVCSLECKQAVLLLRLRNPKPKPKPGTPTVVNSQTPPFLDAKPAAVTRLPTTDECFYVREDVGGSNSEPSFCGDQQTELLRQKLDIRVVTGGDLLPHPIVSFSPSNLPNKRLLRNMEAAGYEIPTPVQMQAIPAALAGKSLVVSAHTGSGKTCSFLVPIVLQCSKSRHDNSLLPKNPLAMVLAPTRELCVQLEEQAKLLGRGLPFKTALVVGGDAMAGQLHRIRQGVELIVATPGRLIDLLTKHDIELDEISVIVLDEVDHMLQQGFRDQVMQIYRALRQPQVLMYSATVSQEVEKMAKSMRKDLSFISIGKPNKPSGAIKQIAIWVESKRKKQKLFDIVMSKQHFVPPAVVFVGSRLGADLLSEAISVATGLKSLSIHGEKPMEERREIMRSFLLGEVPVIVATGILGRGVDLLFVRQVIVFDLPNSIKEYVHQIGRASRLGQEGRAIVFVNEEDKKLFPELVDILKSSGAVIPRELVAPWHSSSGKRQRKR